MNGHESGEELLTEVLSNLGVTTHTGGDESTPSDLFLSTDVGTVPVYVKRWASFPDSAIERNPHLRSQAPVDAVRLVVADRISANARERLTDLDWGWLDLRGHLRLRAPGLIIDTDVPPMLERLERTDALSGRAGVEIACIILAAPTAEHSIRGLARAASRSASTVSEIVKALRVEGLLPAQGFAPDPELFWRVSGQWQPRFTYVSRVPSVQDSDEVLELGLRSERESGWALSGDRVAATLGAPLPLRADALYSFYVPSPTAVRRAIAVLGRANDRNSASAAIAVAPVRAVCDQRVDLDLEWPCAHPLFVALGLAADAGRGREVLEAWHPDFRVW